ncbi:MAG: two-component system LytT family response regulator [Flavobacteriales bacterium]|jgi:two-component system LytT family response regulator
MAIPNSLVGFPDDDDTPSYNTKTGKQKIISEFLWAVQMFIKKPFESRHLIYLVKKITYCAQQETNRANELQTQKMIINHANSKIIVSVAEIVRCQSDNNYTVIYLSNGKSHTSSKPLAFYQTFLPSNLFCRIHQSHLININFVDKVNYTKSCSVELSNGDILPISVRQKKNFFDHLHFYL